MLKQLFARRIKKDLHVRSAVGVNCGKATRVTIGAILNCELLHREQKYEKETSGPMKDPAVSG